MFHPASHNSTWIIWSRALSLQQQILFEYFCTGIFYILYLIIKNLLHNIDVSDLTTLHCMYQLKMESVCRRKKANYTYIIRCGENSIRQVVEGEIRRCIYFYEGHLLLTDFLSDWAAAASTSRCLTLDRPTSQCTANRMLPVVSTLIQES